MSPLSHTGPEKICILRTHVAGQNTMFPLSLTTPHRAEKIYILRTHVTGQNTMFPLSLTTPHRADTHVTGQNTMFPLPHDAPHGRTPFFYEIKHSTPNAFCYHTLNFTNTRQSTIRDSHSAERTRPANSGVGLPG